MLVGEIKHGREIGFIGSPGASYRGVSCPDCGDLHWVRYSVKRQIPNGTTRCYPCGIVYREKYNYRGGEKNPSWKGETVGNKGLHTRMRRLLPKPRFCAICKVRSPYDLTNISGQYLTTPEDWKWLCRKCHMASDGRLEEFRKRASLNARNAAKLRWQRWEQNQLAQIRRQN